MANENINVNEGVINAAKQVAEAIPVKAKGKFGVIVTVVVGGCALIAGTAMVIRNKNKKKAKEQQATSDVDNMDVVKHDFEDCGPENENE
jgi:hypothetical protein